MSVKHELTVECPYCKEPLHAEQWETLNAQMDPAAKEHLLRGELFSAACEKCGRVSRLDYPMLYHDPEHRVMVQYVQPGKDARQSEAEMRTAYEALRTDELTRTIEGYTIRFVTDQQALVEKAILFEIGLDDRVVEIVKLFFTQRFSESHPDAELTGAWFLTGPEGEWAVQLNTRDGQTLRAPVQRELYELLRERLSELTVDPDCRVIDREWAIRAMSE